MAIVKIGFFSLKDNVGCTNFSIHTANYLASGDKSVAVIEPKTVLEPEFHTAEVIFEDNGTFYINGAHYYPQKCNETPNEDIEIYDFGKITVLHEFENDIDKLFLCTDGQGDDIDDIKEYIAETGITCELLIIGASKEQLTLYKEETGLHALLIQSKSDKYCPQDLVLKISLLFRRKGILAPEQNRNWNFDKLGFGSGPIIPEEEKPKKNGFGLFGKDKKKKENEETTEDVLDTSSNEPETPEKNEEFSDNLEEEISVFEEEDIVSSNEYTEINYVSVPAPVVPASLPESETKPEPKPEKTDKKPVKEKAPVKQNSQNTHNKKKTPLFNFEGMKQGAANIVKAGIDLSTQIKEKYEEKAEQRPEKQKVIHTGHITIFVTSFRHGCGSSYTAGSIASSMASIYQKDVYIERKSTEAMLPDDYMVKEIKDEDDQFEAYKNGLIVYDKGLYDELNEVDRSDMIHADMNVMVATNDDMSRIAKFIHEQGDKAYSWLFVFNHVLPNQKKDIEDALADYNVMILPFHDFSNVPPKLVKEWKMAIKACSTRV